MRSAGQRTASGGQALGRPDVHDATACLSDSSFAAPVAPVQVFAAFDPQQTGRISLDFSQFVYAGEWVLSV